jgi:HAD superfamily hydrolase (TIGR01509 family)
VTSEFPYAAVLLDVDGTLVDSNDAHAHAWVDVLGKNDHPVDFDRVRRLIGTGGDKLVELLTGLPADSAANKKLGEERSVIFRDKYLERVRPLPGARELVLKLRDRKLPYAIATAAKNSELQPILEIAGISDLMDLRTTSSEVDKSKPDPDVVQVALKKVGGDASTAVMIGDTPYDVQAALDAGVACIGFLSGGWTAKELSGCAAVYRGPADLASML